MPHFQTTAKEKDSDQNTVLQAYTT